MRAIIEVERGEELGGVDRRGREGVEREERSGDQWRMSAA